MSGFREYFVKPYKPLIYANYQVLLYIGNTLQR